MNLKDRVKQYENSDLCAKWENNIPLREVESLEFFLTDSQDVSSLLGDFPFLPAEDITGYVCSIKDGDYSEVYVTESSRPYDLSAIYHPLSYYVPESFDWQFEQGFSITMTYEQVLACSHQGECYDDCKQVAHELNLVINPALAQRELKEYGAWDESELSDHDENIIRLVWLAAGSIKEENRL